MEIDLSKIDLDSLEDDPDYFEPYKPELTVGRALKMPGEGLKRAGRAFATSARSHVEFVHREEQRLHELLKQQDPEKIKTLMERFPNSFRTTPEMNTAILSRMEAGEDPQVAEFYVIQEHYLANQDRQIENLKRIEESKVLESPPEFRGISSGTFEDVVVGVFGSAPGTLGMIVDPIVGVPMIYAHMQGASTEQMEKAAEQNGLDIDPDRIFTASSSAALINTPLEMVGELFKIKGIFGSGPFKARLGMLAESFGGEGLTELVQNFPEEVAIRWALNPDLDDVTLTDHIKDTITDLQTWKDAAYEGFVGGLSGLATAGTGMLINGGVQRLIHPRQRAINEARRARAREILEKPAGEMTDADKADLLSMVGMDPAKMAEQDPDRIDAAVEAVRGRLLFQGDIIQSEGRDNIEKTLQERRNMSAKDVGLMMNIWDGMARVSAEQGLIEKPEDFYSEWLGGVRLTSWEEFNAAQVRKQVNKYINENGPALFQKMAGESGASVTGFLLQTEVAKDRLKRRQAAGEVDLTNLDDQALNDIVSLMVDDTSGFNEARIGTARYETVQRAQQFIEQSMAELGDDYHRGVYVEMDLKNLGGLNSLLGSSGANKVYRAIADIIKNEMSNLYADVSFFRHGGDEMSAVVVGAEQAQVEAAMLRAQIEAERFARNEKVPDHDISLIDIPHAKYPNELTKRGTGVIFAVEDIDPNVDHTEIISKADKRLEDRKKGIDHEYTRQVDKARGGAFGEQPRRTTKGAGQTGSGIRQKEGGKQKAPDEKVQPDQDVDDDLNPSNFFFQDQEAPRGAVAYLQEQTPKIIYLFENADDSTLIHETGHILLEMMFRVKSSDYQVAAKWAEVDERRAAAGTDQWTTDELEKFAKGFELYMLKGQAPTMRLHAVYKRLQTMLLNIYAKIRNSYFKDIDINNEIKSVFDRWMATEYERSADPFFEVSQWYRVEDLAIHEQELIERAQAEPDRWTEMEYDQVVAEARRRVAVRKEQKKKKLYKELDRTFKRQAEELIETDPFYEMMTDIQNRSGLSIQSLRDLYDQAYINDILAKRPGLFRKDGLPVDVVANEFGYDTTDELVQEILNRPGKQEAIDQAFDDLWREYESSEHLANIDAYAESLDVEIELFNEMMGRKKPAARTDLKKIIREQTGQTSRQVPDARALREQFTRDARVAREAWRKAAKATRELEKAKGDARRTAQLTKERIRQLNKIAKLKLQHLEKVRAVREGYRKAFDRSRIFKRINRQIRNKRMLPEYRSQITNFLSGYIQIPQTLKGDPPAMDLGTFVESRIEQGEILDTLKGLLAVAPERRRPGGRLSHSEVETIGDIVDALVHLEITERKQRLIDEKETIQRVADEMIDSIIDTYPSPKTTPGPLGLKQLTWYQKMGDDVRRWYAELRAPEFIINAIDGFKAFGPNYKNLFEPIKKAEDAKLTMGAEYLQKLNDIWKGFDRAWARRRYKIKGVPGGMTKEQMIMVALNAGNEGNRAAMINGNGITEEMIDDIIGMLSPKEQNLVANTWKLIDSLFPELNRVHKKLTGVRLKKVDGQYFPLVFDPRESWKAGQFQSERELRDLFANQYIWARVGAGHRVERKGGKMPVLLNFSVIHRHIEKTLHDITHQIPIRNVQKLIHNEKFRNTMQAWVGPEIYGQLTPWLAHVANPHPIDPDGFWGKLPARLRANTTIVALGLKVSVAMKQALSLTQTMHKIGFIPTLRGIAEFYKHPHRIREVKAFVDELSPAMKHRAKAWDRELQSMYRKFDPGARKWTEPMKDGFFAMVQCVDAMATYPTWLGAFHHAMDGSVNEIEANDQAAAVEYADMVVRTTQPTASPKDLAAIQRGSNWKKLITMFYTFFSRFQNQIMEVNTRVRLGKMSAGQAVGAYFYLVVAPAVLGLVINERRLPDWEEMIKAIFQYRMAGIPFVRDIATGIVSDYGYSMSPVQEVGERIRRASDAWADAVTGDPDARRLLRESTYAVGYAVGLPSSQMVIAIDGAFDMAEGRTRNPLRLMLREKREKKR